MHEEILETARYPDVIFRPTKIEGKVAVPGTSEVQLQGKFLLHGSEHDLTVPVHAELTGDHWKGTAKFTVPYIQWGLKSPNTFLLKAAPVVDIELELSGTLQGAVAP
jgi:polyisoprenoid-binding protein YceI